MTARLLEAGEPCTLLKSFIARQGVILIAGLIFLAWTAIRVKLRYERRDLKTFCADCSKQAGQQMVGGALMVGMGLMLAKESGLDALAWYGAQYPFEIVLTTVFTGLFRKWAESGAIRLGRRTRWKWLTPLKFVGQYGPRTGDFRWPWYAAQLAQAVLLIGLPARLVALSLIWCSLYLPDQASPVHLIASGWYHSGLSCDAQTALILYAIPLTGDALQFIIIDKLQAFGFIARAVDASRDFEDLEEGGTAECDTCLIARSDAP